jgi:hypothetical protein
MKWTASIAGDHVGLFLDFSLRRKFGATVSQGGNGCSPVFDVILTSIQKSFGTFD